LLFDADLLRKTTTLVVKIFKEESMSLNQLIDSRDVRFTLFEMLELEKLNRFDAFKDFDRSVYEDTLELAEKIAVQQFYPTNAEGDKTGLKFDPKTGEVKVPESFKRASMPISSPDSIPWLCRRK